MSVEHTLHVQPEGYQEPHNEIGSQNPSQPSPSVGFELRTLKFCVLRVMPLCQAPHIKNKKSNIRKIRILLWFTWLEPISW